jgi:S1-C subfamily serine protease
VQQHLAVHLVGWDPEADLAVSATMLDALMREVQVTDETATFGDADSLRVRMLC